uniref:Uncharacterized protein n=1 Tax=Sus scrofa TaxID=9823 RepID=A0A481DRE0_PIG
MLQGQSAEPCTRLLCAAGERRTLTRPPCPARTPQTGMRCPPIPRAHLAQLPFCLLTALARPGFPRPPGSTGLALLPGVRGAQGRCPSLGRPVRPGVPPLNSALPAVPSRYRPLPPVPQASGPKPTLSTEQVRHWRPS